MVQPFWKTLWQFVLKLNVHLLYNPTNLFLGICPREIKTYAHTNFYTNVFISSIESPQTGSNLNATKQVNG